MTAIEENVLIANGIVRSQRNNELYCSICPIESNSDNWRAHIDNPRHTGALRQFNLVFVENGDKINCKACNMVFDWETIKSHAVWHRIIPWYENEDKDKIFFENRTFQWNNRYYCFPCENIFSNWTDAFVHIGDNKHKALISLEPPVNEAFKPAGQSYQALISEGFEPWGITTVKCKICNCPNVMLRNIPQHVESYEHLDATLRFIKELETRDGISALKIVDDGKNHNNKNLGNAESMINKLPNVPIVSEVPAPFSQKSQEFIKKKYHNAQGQSNDNNFVKQSRQNSSNFPVELRSNGHYCTICEIPVHDTVDKHVTGEQHLSLLRRYGHQYISPLDHVKFRCSACNCTVPNLENVYRHIKGVKHKNIIATKKMAPEAKKNTLVSAAKISTSMINISAPESKINLTPEKPNELLSQNVTRGKTTPFKMNFPQPTMTVTRSTWTKTLPFDFFVKQNPDKYFCRLCDVQVHSEKGEYHLKSDQAHRRSVDMFHADIMIESDKVSHCRPCKRPIYGRESLWQHIHDMRHRLTRAASSVTPLIGHPLDANAVHSPKSIPRPLFELPTQTSTNKGKNLNRNGATAKEIEKWIVKLSGTDYACKVCHLLMSDHSTIEKHVDSKHHADFSKLYANTIPSEDEKFYCRACRCTIPNFANVYQHAIGIRHKASTNIPSTNNATFTTAPQDIELLGREFISQTDVDGYNCRVCNVYLVGRSSIDEHTKSSSHASSIVKNGCENIFYLRGNKYRCEWCNCEIPSLDNLYVHLAGKRHPDNLLAKRKIVPNCTNERETSPGDAKTTSTVVDNERSEKSNDTEKPEHTTSQSNIQSSQSLRGSSDSLRDGENSSDITIKSEGVSSDRPQLESPKIRSASVCEFRSTSVDSERNPSPKNSNINYSTNESKDSAMPNVSSKIDDRPSSEIDDRPSLRLSNETIATGYSDFVNVQSIASSSLSLNETGSVVRKRRAPKIVFDYDDDYIHDMRDKLREIEKGFKLCFVKDTNDIYCLICHEKVVNAMHNYYEHLWSIEHCEYLEGMEKDHVQFELTPGQYSELDLAYHYMEEKTEEVIYCHICDEEMNNIDVNIRNHMNNKDHKKRIIDMHDKVKSLIDVQTRITCDWYNIFKYLCVPCTMNFESEITFAKHLKCHEHATVLKKTTNSDRTFIYDFCSPCALLWYGYRSAYADHCQIPTHKWLIRDENYVSPKLPTSAKCLLAMPCEYMADTLKYINEISPKEKEKFETVVRDLENAAKLDYPDVKAYPFGSRVAGLNSLDNNIHVFLDCGNMYDGNTSSEDRMAYVKKKISECLMKEKQCWEMEEVLATNQPFIIKSRHRETGLLCEIHFDNGLAYENTSLIKYLNEKYPVCRKMIIFLKQWLEFCGLSGPENITTDALCWFVIFYLQNEYLRMPTIDMMIEMKKESHLIAGWEVGVIKDLTSVEKVDYDMKELLVGFFTFYADFDYRRSVACPLIGKTIKKRDFTIPKSLPKAMEPYINYTKSFENPKPFRIESPMCLQHPFDLKNNLTKAVNKVNLSRFRTFCFKSLDVLDTPLSQ